MANLKDGRPSFADKVRQNIAVLREESALEKKYLALLIGAAAQLADNNDGLIEEAADVALDTLND